MSYRLQNINTQLNLISLFVFLFFNETHEKNLIYKLISIYPFSIKKDIRFEGHVVMSLGISLVRDMQMRNATDCNKGGGLLTKYFIHADHCLGPE